LHKQALLSLLEESPVIAAVKEEARLGDALASDCGVIFLLGSSLLSVERSIARIKDADKLAFVHIDLVHGLAPREVAVDFIRQNTRADGIISTKPQLLRHARALGLLAVQRFFLLDSMALENSLRQMGQDDADLVEVLPGVMPKIIRRMVAASSSSLIAGGLIADKEDVVSALSAGASAVSTTLPGLWAV
jgi:glycerol uptake operon antiterminator